MDKTTHKNKIIHVTQKQCAKDIVHEIKAHTSEIFVLDYSDYKKIEEVSHLTFYVKEHAKLNIELLITDTKKHTLFLDVIFQGEYAQATINGAYILSGNEQLIINTKQIHRASHTESTLTLHGVLNDSAQVEYKGIATIEQSAPFSNALQQNKNILLSKKARAISIPSLEALHHDVYCAHGSAIGQFDQEQLFYMQSRGFKKSTAKKLLLHSFIYPLFTESALQQTVTHFIDHVSID